MTLRRTIKVGIKRAIGFKGTRKVNILAGPARGLTMNLDFSGQTPMYLGMYEWELHRWLRATLPGVRLTYDIGGYMGYYALMFALNSGGRVVTFEPDPGRAELLRENIAHNPLLQPRISVNTMSIGRKNGDGTVTLDSLSESAGPPGLIKMDIDGGELDALAGGLTVLREKRPHVLVETHSPELERECGTLLAECGYRPLIKHNRRVWREYRGGAELNRWLLARGDPQRS